jgi:antitoxin FitA
MPDLIVRGVDSAVVRALKARAGMNGRSAEAEHRHILASALAKPNKRSFAEVLSSMPNVGDDEDFARARSDSKVLSVFD